MRNFCSASIKARRTKSIPRSAKHRTSPRSGPDRGVERKAPEAFRAVKSGPEHHGPGDHQLQRQPLCDFAGEGRSLSIYDDVYIGRYYEYLDAHGVEFTELYGR